MEEREAPDSVRDRLRSALRRRIEARNAHTPHVQCGICGAVGQGVPTCSAHLYAFHLLDPDASPDGAGRGQEDLDNVTLAQAIDRALARFARASQTAVAVATKAEVTRECTQSDPVACVAWHYITVVEHGTAMPPVTSFLRALCLSNDSACGSGASRGGGGGGGSAPGMHGDAIHAMLLRLWLDHLHGVYAMFCRGLVAIDTRYPMTALAVDEPPTLRSVVRWISVHIGGDALAGVPAPLLTDGDRSASVYDHERVRGLAVVAGVLDVLRHHARDLWVPDVWPIRRTLLQQHGTCDPDALFVLAVSDDVMPLSYAPAGSSTVMDIENDPLTRTAYLYTFATYDDNDGGGGDGAVREAADADARAVSGTSVDTHAYADTVDRVGPRMLMVAALETLGWRQRDGDSERRLYQDPQLPDLLDDVLSVSFTGEPTTESIQRWLFAITDDAPSVASTVSLLQSYDGFALTPFPVGTDSIEHGSGASTATEPGTRPWRDVRGSPREDGADAHVCRVLPTHVFAHPAWTAHCSHTEASLKAHEQNGNRWIHTVSRIGQRVRLAVTDAMRHVQQSGRVLLRPVRFVAADACLLDALVADTIYQRSLMNAQGQLHAAETQSAYPAVPIA